MVSQLLLCVLVAPSAEAQSDLSGRVVAGTAPVAGATISVTPFDSAAASAIITSYSDKFGRYRFVNIPAGEHWVVVRAPGFTPDSTLISFERDVSLKRDVTLTRIVLADVTELAEVRVRATARVPSAKMRDFEERRLAGHGRFIDRELLEKNANRRLGDVMTQVPGVVMRRGGTKAWASNGRTTSNGRCLMCGQSVPLDRADVAAGAKPACYMDVYVDGTMVYSAGSRSGQPLFDLNSVNVRDIEGVEVHAGASVPAQFNRTAGGCGVVLIWLRNS